MNTCVCVCMKPFLSFLISSLYPQFPLAILKSLFPEKDGLWNYYSYVCVQDLLLILWVQFSKSGF